ncbi:ferrochelatase [Actinomycetota bacterium]
MTTDAPVQPDPADADASHGAPATDPLAPYDGILLLSFGGPESAEEIIPFLRRVTAGKGIPDERLAVVGEHYHLFGGRSPINDQNRALLAALRTELDARGSDVPLLWGNRNAAPFTSEALTEAAERGLGRVVTVVTSAYPSYSSCRQYREDLAVAVQEVTDGGAPAPVVDKVRPYALHPGFSRTNARLVREAVASVADAGEGLRLLFVTHSIPDAMDEMSGPGDGEGREYSREHVALAAAIRDEVNAALGLDLQGELVFCSRSGPPHQPWLEPDVNDRLAELAAEGASTVVLAPIGFVSDHMEVVYDLDTEARATCERLGLEMVRVPTVGTDPEFVAGLVDLLEERAAEARGEPVTPAQWPDVPARPSVCDPGCCPNLRAHRPALCGRD